MIFFVILSVKWKMYQFLFGNECMKYFSESYTYAWNNDETT